MTDAITFRPLAEEDLPLMHRWLNTPHVAEWYYAPGVPHPSLEWVKQRYMPRILGDDPTRAFTIRIDGRPIGYIQAYFVADNPEYAAAVQVPPGTAGIDMFIGEEDVVHRGLGSRIIGRFVEQVIYGEMGAEIALLGPEPANRIAIRAYKKAGFHHLKTVDIPDGDAEQEYLMVRERPGAPRTGRLSESP